MNYGIDIPLPLSDDVQMSVVYSWERKQKFLRVFADTPSDLSMFVILLEKEMRENTLPGVRKGVDHHR